ncbi:MAG: hypothetical protein M1376_15455 [Planctomycetes bacterium]|nr:hypothetical protein [Planctomycetota bacterium]
MIPGKMIAAMGLVIMLALVSSAQMNDWREGSPPPTMVMSPQPQPPGGPGPMPPLRMRELADQLRARAREAQELSDRLRRQADELDQMAMRLVNRGPGPQQPGSFQPVPPGPRMEEREEIKRQIERLRDESRRAKEQGRMEDSERIWKEADRLEQLLREQGPKGQGPDGSFKDEVVRSLDGLKKEIGRLWQAVNEMRNRPREDKPL